MDIQFYHLLSTPLERALPKLVEKAYGAGFRVLIRAHSAEQVEHLNNLLWTYDPNKFLPHGSAKDGNKAAQPIYLASDDENPNQATLLVITDGSDVPANASFTRTLDIFDGANDEATAAARTRWSNYKSAGHNLTYYKQTDSGSWEKAA